MKSEMLLPGINCGFFKFLSTKVDFFGSYEMLHSVVKPLQLDIGREKGIKLFEYLLPRLQESQIL